MQFYCYECHKPHTPGKVKPKNEDCLRCHTGVPKIGKHKVHLEHGHAVQGLPQAACLEGDRGVGQEGLRYVP